MALRKTDRRSFLGLGLTTAGGLALAACGSSPAAASSTPAADASAVGDIYRLQAPFHRAETTQDLDLMMLLWADDALLTAASGASSPIKGASDLRSYWASTGSSKNHRFSLVPSFKTQTKVIGDRGTLYFECHDVANFDTAPAIVNDTFLGGTLKRVGRRWLFWQRTAGPSSPRDRRWLTSVLTYGDQASSIRMDSHSRNRRNGRHCRRHHSD